MTEGQLRKMENNELFQYAKDLTATNGQHVEVIRKLHHEMDALKLKVKELEKDLVGVRAKRDSLEIQIGVTERFNDRLLEKILKYRGYND